MKTVTPLLLFGAVLLSACDPACEVFPRVVGSDPPLKRIEVVLGDYARAELMAGVSARGIVGMDRFAGLEPGWTPEKAVEEFGEPLEIVKKNSDETLFVYEREGARAAVVRHTFLPSGGGPQVTSFHLEAYPPADFVESLPRPLRTFIQDHPEVRRISLSSNVPGDWIIAIHLQDGRARHLSAHAAPPPDVLSPESASSPVAALTRSSCSAGVASSSRDRAVLWF